MIRFLIIMSNSVQRYNRLLSLFFSPLHHIILRVRILELFEGNLKRESTFQYIYHVINWSRKCVNKASVYVSSNVVYSRRVLVCNIIHMVFHVHILKFFRVRLQPLNVKRCVYFSNHSFKRQKNTAIKKF